MRILIIEDERPIAKHIERLCRNLLGNKLEAIYSHFTLQNASSFLFDNQIDLCLLDLNLNGENGYKLLKLAVSGSFHTIIISANIDKALEAFEYGVLDFIAKPFDEERLAAAFDRYFDRCERKELTTKYLSIRKNNKIVILNIDDIDYFKAADIYVEVHLKNNKFELLDKTMERLCRILPPRFIRIHRSYIIDISKIKSYQHSGGGIYAVTTKSGESLPLSRQKYKELHELLNY